MAGRFLKSLSVSRTQSLITSRLMPAPIEGLKGIKHLKLTGLSKEDTVNFLVGEGVTGNRAELEEAGRIYDYHPLMLSLLAAAIKRSRTKDISQAFSMKLIDRKEPHKILSTGFKLLSEEERRVALHLSVFRGGFNFEAAQALLPDIKQDQLWESIVELRSLGFLFCDKDMEYFDFHPIMRAFLYGHLTSSGNTKVHTRAIQYFQAFPEPEKVVTLGDLGPVIELYYHLVKAKKYNEAFQLYKDRIGDPAYYQFSANHLIIELLQQLLHEEDGGVPIPLLETEWEQAIAVNDLACVYACSGQVLKAVSFYLKYIDLSNIIEDLANVATGFGNISQAQLRINQFSASSIHLRKCIILTRDIEEEFQEANCHLKLGHILAFQGNCRNISSQEALDLSTVYFEKTKKYGGLAEAFAYRSLSILLQSRLAWVLEGTEYKSKKQSWEPLEYVHRALFFAEKMAKVHNPNSRDFIKTYWLLGEALVQSLVSLVKIKLKSFDIPFYDEYFQLQTHTVAIAKGNEMLSAERCLHEALRRCRKTNMVDLEPDILLGLARLDRIRDLPATQEYLNEARTIAHRAKYRRVLADYHLLCGQILIDYKSRGKLMGLTAREHLEQAQEYALDVSEFEHLYQSTDPHFYDGIEEYEMLKRGMTKQERIENGYWIAWRIAEELLKKLKSKN